MKSFTKKLTVLALCLAFLASFASTCFASANDELVAEDVIEHNIGATESQLNIAARGDYLYDLTFVCQKDVNIHSYSWYETLYKGNTYHMPYGQGSVNNYIGWNWGVSPEKFLRDAANANSDFYNKTCWANSWYSTYYINDCSGFVSACWGLSVKQSTRSLGSYSNYVASVTTNNIINYIQLGDALNRYDYHVVLVTDLIYTNGTLTGIEITEQTFPDTERHVYTPSQLASTYSSYDGIYRCKYNVAPCPSGVSKNHKLDGQDPVDMGKDFYARIANDNISKYFTDESGEVWARDFSGNNNQVWHFMRQANGAYLVGNYATSKFLSVKDSVYKDGSRLVTGDVTYEANQKFYIFYMYNNFYMMPEGGDMTVDIDCSLFHTQICGTSTGNGTSEASFKARSLNLEILNITDGTRDVTDLGDSFTATIKNIASGKYVTANGASLVAADKNGLDTQKWNFTKMANGAYTITSVSETLAIDVAHTRLAEGTSVDMYDLTNLNAQRFFLIKKDGSYYIKPTYTQNTLSMNATSLDFTTSAASDDSAQKFEISIVGGSSEEALVLKDSSSYGKKETTLIDVSEEQTATTVLSNFENENAVVLDANGNETSANATVGTGYSVALIINGAKIDELVIVILGDVSGEGVVDATDYIKVKTEFTKGNVLAGAYKDAADIDGNGEIESTDYLQIKSHFLGSYNLFA